jgi:hypothetical protein
MNWHTFEEQYLNADAFMVRTCNGLLLLANMIERGGVPFVRVCFSVDDIRDYTLDDVVSWDWSWMSIDEAAAMLLA